MEKGVSILSNYILAIQHSPKSSSSTPSKLTTNHKATACQLYLSDFVGQQNLVISKKLTHWTWHHSPNNEQMDLCKSEQWRRKMFSLFLAFLSVQNHSNSIFFLVLKLSIVRITSRATVPTQSSAELYFSEGRPRWIPFPTQGFVERTNWKDTHHKRTPHNIMTYPLTV